MLTHLPGKRVFITGAAGGIGRKLVIAFIEAGCYVDAADIDETGLDSLRKLYGQSELNTMILDISNLPLGHRLDVVLVSEDKLSCLSSVPLILLYTILFQYNFLCS